MNSKNKQKKRQSLRNNEYYDMQEILDELYEESKNGKKFKNLLEIITSRNNILMAYRNIKNNNGSHTSGTDGITIDYFKDMDTDVFIRTIQNVFKNYSPKSVRRVEIPKPNGTMRPLGIPCMQDRIVQQCIKQVLDPICEAKFYNYSFGFRENRSAKDAIARLQSLVNRAGLNYAVDIDIKGFFDNVDHAKLLKQIWTMGIQDKSLICIISKILECEIDGIGSQNKGTPQGGIISPLLSNIVLNELDWWISHQWHTFETKRKYSSESNKYGVLKRTKLKEMFLVRYADDFKILCRDSKTAFKILNAVKSWLKERLSLDISPEKSKITNLRKNYTEFLGFKLKAKKNKAISKWTCRSHISDKNMSRIQNNLLTQIKIIQKKPTVLEVNKLNSMILGIHNYFKTATNVSLDLNRINFNLTRAINNRLKPKSHGEHSKSYLKLYAKYNKRKVIKVAEIDIYPIYGAINVPAFNFKQDTCSYTEKGRELIHKQIHSFDELAKHIFETSTDESIEFSDNSISLLFQQKGKCSITKQNLSKNTMYCHHKTPIHLGGTHKYNNLVWIDNSIHELIHSSSIENCMSLWTQLKTKLNLKTKSEIKKVLNKVNSFRVLAANFEFILDS